MKTKSQNRVSTAGFTLLELLVVVAIIGVLAVLGLSVASSAMKKSKATKCLNSLRQVGVAIRAYVNDNDGRMPDTSHARADDGTSRAWVNTLSIYLGSDFIGRCPANEVSRANVTYGWNDLLVETDGTGIPSARCRTPASTLAVAESADSYTSEHFHFAGARHRITFNRFKSSVAVERHGQGANYLFVDGHIESLSPVEIKQRLDLTDSTFLKP